MTCLIFLYLAVVGISVFIWGRALFRWFKVKEYFQNTLPYCDKGCIKFFPRYPLWHYRMCSSPWYNRIAEDLVKRNQILMDCDKEKAEQFIRAEKQMYWSWSVGGVATAIFAFTYVMMNMSRDM